MSKNNNTTKASFATSTYASLDHKLGRVGTAVAATGVGAGVGAGVSYATGRSTIIGAGVGAGVGLVTEEAGRLLVDKEAYKMERLRLATRDLASLASEYNLEEMLKAE